MFGPIGSQTKGMREGGREEKGESKEDLENGGGVTGERRGQ